MSDMRSLQTLEIMIEMAESTWGNSSVLSGRFSLPWMVGPLNHVGWLDGMRDTCNWSGHRRLQPLWPLLLLLRLLDEYYFENIVMIHDAVVVEPVRIEELVQQELSLACCQTVKIYG